MFDQKTRLKRMALNAPIHECWISDDLFENGIGYAVISRKMPDGLIAFSCFLLDIYCLGVKDCFLRIEHGSYEELKASTQNKFSSIFIHHTCLRKLVEGAVLYAKNLGFVPHKDYKDAKEIFGDIDASLCLTTYEYGKDGKPFYVAGPNDTHSRKQSIIKQLTKCCGADGFEYMIGFDKYSY